MIITRVARCNATKVGNKYMLDPKGKEILFEFIDDYTYVVPKEEMHKLVATLPNPRIDTRYVRKTKVS